MKTEECCNHNCNQGRDCPLRKVNNEPVAAYINKDDGLVCAKCFNPLYTNPAKELDRAVELYTDKAIKVEQLEKELTEAGGMIGVLREYISDLEKGLDSSIKLNKAQAERNAEPVAWMDEDENVVFEKCKVYPIPLYTHPVKETLDTQSYLMGRYDTSPVKELTDEEIKSVWSKMVCSVHMTSAEMAFAKAILKKAQEK